MPLILHFNFLLLLTKMQGILQHISVSGKPTDLNSLSQHLAGLDLPCTQGCLGWRWPHFTFPTCKHCFLCLDVHRSRASGRVLNGEVRHPYFVLVWARPFANKNDTSYKVLWVSFKKENLLLSLVPEFVVVRCFLCSYEDNCAVCLPSRCCGHLDWF